VKCRLCSSVPMVFWWLPRLRLYQYRGIPGPGINKSKSSYP
jgi:hypothetical protein